jgi:TM2 domain-containing membrane protein YozV
MSKDLVIFILSFICCGLILAFCLIVDYMNYLKESLKITNEEYNKLYNIYDISKKEKK